MAYYIRYEKDGEQFIKKVGNFTSAKSHGKHFCKQGFKKVRICAAKDILKEGLFVI